MFNTKRHELGKLIDKKLTKINSLKRNNNV